eukprot:gene3230-4044_t
MSNYPTLTSSTTTTTTTSSNLITNATTTEQLATIIIQLGGNEDEAQIINEKAIDGDFIIENSIDYLINYGVRPGIANKWKNYVKIYSISNMKKKEPVTSASYSNYYKEKEIGIQDIHHFGVEDPKNAPKSFCSQWGKHVGETELQKYLADEFFKTFNNYPIKIIDSSNTKTLTAIGSDVKPDWCLYDKQFPPHPSWFIAVGDTKLSSKEKSFPSYKASGQALYHADLVLKKSPYTTVHAFVTTGEQICFWRVTKSKTGGQHHYDNNELLPKEIMEIQEIDIHKVEFEAEGLSSWVYSISYKGEDLALKVYKNTESSQKETSMIKILESKLNEGIPKIIESGKNWNIIRPLGDIMDSDSKLSNYRKLFDIILATHQYNIIHRDIRPSNIIVTKSKESNEDVVVLIDWSSSVMKSNEEIRYEGTIYTAPNHILKLKDRPYVPNFHDVLESFVKTFIVLTVR